MFRNFLYLLCLCIDKNIGSIVENVIVKTMTLAKQIKCIVHFFYNEHHQIVKKVLYKILLGIILKGENI